MTHPCDSVLVPTELRTKEDYSLAQAYAYANAANDYELLKSGNAVDQSLGLVYKMFSLDVANSSNAQQFQERVRQRLSSMGFSMTEQSAQSHYRRGLEPFQTQAWLECVRTTAPAPGTVNNPNVSLLLAFVGESTKTAAAVHFNYRPGVGVNDHVLTLSVDGGTINSQTHITNSSECSS